MPVQTGSRSPQAVLDASIEACEKQIAGSDFLKRALVCVSVGLLFVLALVVADHTWPGGLPAALASGAFVFGVIVVFVVLVVCAALVIFRRLNPLFAARQLERSHDVPHNTVINALLLRGRKDAGQVVNAVTRRAAIDLVTSDVVTGVGVPDRRPRILLMVTCGLWLLYALLAPKSVLQSIGRLLGSPSPSPTITQLELVEPDSDDVVYAGEPLTIRVRVAGRVPDEVTFSIAPPVVGPDAPPMSYEMQPVSDADGDTVRQLVLAPSEVTEAIHYTCRAGDARLVGVIEVHPQPDILGYLIHLTPPDYVGREAETVSEPDLLVWPGTQATIEVESNVEVHSPVFVFVSDVESRSRMRVDPGRPMSMSVSRRLMRSGRYRIEFADRWGYVHQHPDWHQIAVRGDAPPEVRIDVPARDENSGDVVDLTKYTRLAASASDDVGVAAIDFVMEHADGESTRIRAAKAADTASRSLSGEVASEQIQLAVGQRARAWFEARDARELPDGTAAPQTVRSRIITLIRTAEEPMMQPEGGEGEKGGDAPSSGSEEMDDEIPGQADSGGKDEPSDAPNEPQPGQDGQQPADEDDRPPDSEGEAERFMEEHAEELREIGEAMERSGDDEAREGESDGEPSPESGGDSDAGNDADDSEQGGSSGGDDQGESGERPGDEQPSGAEGEPQRKDGDGEADQSGDEAKARQQGSEMGDEESSDSGEQGNEDSPEGQPDSDGTSSEQSEESGDGSAGESDQESQGDPSDRQPGEAESPPGEKSDQGDASEEGGESGEEPGQGGERGESGASQTPPSDGAGADGKGESAGESDSEPSESGEQPGEQEGKSGESGQSGSGETDGQQGDGKQGEAGDAPGGEGQSSQNQEPGEQGGEKAGSGGGDRPGDDEPLSGEAALDPVDSESRPPQSRSPRIRTDGKTEIQDVLEILRRRGEIPPEVLAELGWSRAKAAEFTRALQRMVDLERAAGTRGTPEQREVNTQVGDRGTQRGRGVANDASARADQDRNRNDELGKLTPPPDQRISPRLRKLLDAYYRSMAQQRKTRAAEKTDSP